MMNNLVSSDAPPIELNNGDQSRIAERYGGLDVLRCIAMTAVVGQHCDILLFGWSGVWLFYVISGFVVTFSIEGNRKGWMRDLVWFYWKRLWRITPSYYLFLATAIFVSFLQGSELSRETVDLAATFRLNEGMGDATRFWFPNFPISHLWTIAVEMKFYAALGVIFVFCTRFIFISFLISIIIICPCLRFVLTLTEVWHYQELGSSVIQADAFAAGALICSFRHRITLRLARWMMAIGTASVIVFSVFYICMNAVYRHAHGIALLKGIVSGADASGQLREVVVFSVMTVFFSGLVALTMRMKTDSSALRIAERFGRMSYSGYLWHFAIITALRSMMRAFGVTMDASFHGVPATLVLWVFSMILLYPLSLFFYRFVETPCNRLGRVVWTRYAGVRVPFSRARVLR